MPRSDNTRSKTLEEKIDYFLSSLDKTYPSTRTLMWRSFMMGIFTALGATVGFSLVVALVTFILTQASIVPGINNIIQQTHLQELFPQK